MTEEREFSNIRISPLEDGARFRFLLSPGAHDRRSPIAFEVTNEGAMALLHTLQGMQAKFRIPTPPTLRPRGPPTLKIVTDE